MLIKRDESKEADRAKQRERKSKKDEPEDQKVHVGNKPGKKIKNCCNI